MLRSLCGQLRPREGAGQLPALLLDLGLLPEITLCLCLGREEGDPTVFTKGKRKEAELSPSASTPIRLFELEDHGGLDSPQDQGMLTDRALLRMGAVWIVLGTRISTVAGFLLLRPLVYPDPCCGVCLGRERDRSLNGSVLRDLGGTDHPDGCLLLALIFSRTSGTNRN